QQDGDRSARSPSKAPSREDGMPTLAFLVPFGEKLHRFFLSKGRPQVAASIIITSMLGSSSRKICKASGIQVNSCPVRKPIAKHGLAGWATRRAASAPASACVARLGRDRGRLVPRLLVRCGEHYGP